MDKKELRKHIRAAKNAVPFDEKEERSVAIMEKVSAMPRFQQSSVVLLYWSMVDEVQTHAFVERCYSEWGKTVLLPCVEGDELRLRQYKGRESMQVGPMFGIDEPTGEVFSDWERIELIVVPGVAFDRAGHRMGRGKGYYDKLLAQTPRAYKVGVAFDFQMVDEVPVEPHDIMMDAVVSEN